MNKFLKDILREINLYKWYLISALAFIVLSYSSYIFFNEPTINQIGDEDGFFENLTALVFFLTFAIFVTLFIKKRYPILLLFAAIFFIGTGEEISWGQRIFQIQTPEELQKENVQKELNFHNLKVFSKQEKDDILTINFLYKLFWLSYCFLLPLLFIRVKFIDKIVNAIKLPVPPVSVGFLFIGNWFLFKIIKDYLLSDGKSLQYYDLATEVGETNSAMLFFMVSLIFLVYSHKILNYKND
jgi:hypothetical protein